MAFLLAVSSIDHQTKPNLLSSALMASICLFLPTIMMKLLTFIVFFVYVESIDQQKPDNGVVINVTKHFSFSDFKSPRTAHDLKLLGSSVVDEMGRVRIPDTTGKDVDLKHLAGRAIYAHPVRVFDPVTRTPASIQTTFTFQLETTQSNSSSGGKNGGGDDGGGGSGFTFMFAPDEFTVGRPGPWLGMLNDACDEEYKAVGIEFDTRENVEFGDPNDNHVGINLGSIVSTITINASEFGVNLKDGEIHRVWVDYGGENRFLDIRLGSDLLGYPSKPMFSGRLDISDFMKEYMFVGFTASTGNFTQIHNLFSWNFTSTSQASLRAPSPETCESKLIVGDDDNGGGGDSNRLNGFFIFMTVALVIALALVSFYYNRKQKSGDTSNDAVMLPAAKERPRPPNKPRRFTIAEISSATRGFDELHKVVSDERGDTYMGTLLNGSHVAVKRFSTSYLRSHGVYWRRVGKEIKAMSKLRHPNLVAIRGWCFGHEETMVVYEYVSNGNFNEWLYGVGVLPWSRRLRVVRDVAQALSYLHSHKLAHKNVTTSSVFIDVSFRAMLGDFGFVMSGVESNQFEAAVSQPADVFSFGVLVLEVVAGRKRYKSESDPDSDLDRDLLEWAWIMHEMNEKEKVVDGKMCSVLNMDQAVQVMEIGLLCTLQESKGRPSMAEVVEYVSFEKEVPELPASRPMALFPYTSTTGLCSSSYMCPSFK